MAMHVNVSGRIDAPVVVLLHSIATSHAMWAPQQLAWASRFRVLAVDLPGHGDSMPLAGSPVIADFAATVTEVLRSINVDRAAFVGLSFGGMIVQYLAANDPRLVRAAVVANAVGVMPEPARKAWAERCTAAERSGMAAQRDSTLERWFTSGFRHNSPMTTAAIGDLVSATSVEGYCAAARAIADLDHRALLPRIAVPSLVVAGKHDAAAPAPAVRGVAELIPRAEFVELDAGHLSNVETADAFTEQVGAFLSAWVA